MTSPQKRRGDKAELEVQRIINDELGFPARRELGAGRQDDMGDIAGVPNHTIQVANYTNIAVAINEKVPKCIEQQARKGSTFGATFLRRPGGRYVVVLSVQQWATYVRESLRLRRASRKTLIAAFTAAMESAKQYGYALRPYNGDPNSVGAIAHEQRALDIGNATMLATTAFLDELNNAQ